MYDRSGTGRFYGIGNQTHLTDQSTFINRQMRLEGSIARNFTQELQLAYLFRANTVEIEQSAISSLPAITAKYPTVNGVGDASELAQRLTLTYDTRDSSVVPHRGVRMSALAGGTSRAFGSSVNYLFAGMDASIYQPIRGSPRSTLVTHAAVRYMPSAGNAPFWALSQLGGESSVPGEALPLRAVGYGRFVDRNAAGASLEWRNAVAQLRLFDTDMSLELSPFVDTGKVFARMGDSPFSQLHPSAGMGFRLIASPFVVGFLDIGIGTEKLAVFTGIDYPF
jgi:outer membrane protein assembly factor BamA